MHEWLHIFMAFPGFFKFYQNKKFFNVPFRKQTVCIIRDMLYTCMLCIYQKWDQFIVKKDMFPETLHVFRFFLKKMLKMTYSVKNDARRQSTNNGAKLGINFMVVVSHKYRKFWILVIHIPNLENSTWIFISGAKLGCSNAYM